MKRTILTLALLLGLSTTTMAGPVVLSPRDPGPASTDNRLRITDEALSCFRIRLLEVYLPMGVTHERAAELAQAYCGWNVSVAVDRDGDVSYIVWVRSGTVLQLYYTFAVVRP